MTKFISFSSGSSGNCYLLLPDKPGSGIMIDAGISMRRLKKYFMEHGLSFDDFGAVLVTHDHNDHIGHLGSICKKIGKPVYATDVLHNALSWHNRTRDHIASCRKILKPGEWNEVNGSLVRYFEVPHDATQTVGYAINTGDCNFVIMTDIGRMTEEGIAFAKGADTVVVESNYDVKMLLGGNYPFDLKMRICKGNGHISNDECADAIRRFYHPGLKNIFLCHLSENNNEPGLAFKASETALEAVRGKDEVVRLKVLPRRVPSDFFLL